MLLFFPPRRPLPSPYDPLIPLLPPPSACHAMLQATRASDVYAFGVIAWGMYTRLQPFIVSKEGRCTPNPLFKRWFKNTPAAYRDMARR